MRLRKQLRDLVKEIKELENKDNSQYPRVMLTAPAQDGIQAIVDSAEALSIEKQ